MPRKVLIVSHDAGGAEILSAWRQEHLDHYDIAVCVKGPAQRIFERDHPDISHADLDEISSLERGDLVLTGTSLKADHERQAIRLARQYNIPSASFIDHWTNYRRRFGSADDWLDHLPDEVWIGDAYGVELARSLGFPPNRIKEVPNPYFQKIHRLLRHNRTRREPRDKLSLLFIGEPFNLNLQSKFGQQWTHYDNEQKNLNHLFEAIQRFQDRIERVTLRPHPSEDCNKYTIATGEYSRDLPVVHSENQLLFNDIDQHDAVVGIESMGLVIAVIMSKPTFSCITGRPWKIALPHREIIRVDHYDTVFSRILSAS